MTATLDDEVAELRRDNAELRRRLDERTGERDEALAQKSAIAEVMGVINSSPGDLMPVFDAMLEKALRLCEAAFGLLIIWDGEQFHRVAFRGVPPELIEAMRQPLKPVAGGFADRLVRGERVIAIADLLEAGGQPIGPGGQLLVTFGTRSYLGVALRRDEALLGAIVVYRREVRPFSDQQIALLENFGAQAVIAMENARLLTETREALEQQTATAEVLQVINSSPGDLAPVFDAILEKAHTLCGAELGSLVTYDGGHFRALTTHGYPEEYAAVLRQPFPPTTFHRPLVIGEHFVHIANTAAVEWEPGNELFRLAVEASGAGTILLVPLRKDDALLGLISAVRKEVRPFTDKQIALLQNFAAQAVIAMENARLLTETREALEQQTATAEVLQVINSSPGDLDPVFNAMLEKAMHLCGASFGLLTRVEGENFRAVALRGAPPALAEFLRQPQRTVPGLAHHKAMQGEDVIHIEDITTEDVYRSGDPARRALADIGGARTGLCVALRKDDALLGTIIVYRQEVRPFTDKQIALLQNFAAQAVIAMENARLITETREALEQQTATAEVLQVINSSPGDLTPVFEAILEKATHLCEADSGIFWIYHGEDFRPAAYRGTTEAFSNFLRQHAGLKPSSRSLDAIQHGEPFVHNIDLAEINAGSVAPLARAVVDLEHARTGLLVPLLKDGALLGAIRILRRQVRPFSQKQITLFKNFAAQAVIAMENARLLTETREALEQQTATAEVLQVINSSPGDPAPVFDAMLEKATRLCEAPYGQLAVYDGELFRFVAVHGESDYAQQQRRDPIPPSHGVTWLRIVGGAAIVHVADVLEDDGYFSTEPSTRVLVDASGMRTVLTVALRKDEALLGVLTVYRQEVRPFTDKQIALLENFAAQAVIAMENARLITETREALEQQTATSEVLQVINSSPGDLAPVFDAMLEKAMRLCEASFGMLRTFDGECFHLAAARDVPAALQDLWRGPTKPAPGGAQERLARGERFVHHVDAADDEGYRRGAVTSRALGDLAGARTYLTVPLRQDERLLGSIAIYRKELRPFTDKQIALLQNFAAQAVIAMENARLLTEMHEALEQQTATAEVLQVINSSPGDLAPVFHAILEKAHNLCGVSSGGLIAIDGERYRPLAIRGEPGFTEYWMQQGWMQFSTTVVPALLRRGEPVHIPDLTLWNRSRVSDQFNRLMELSDSRCMLLVPLRKDDVLFGVITALRKEALPFSDKEIVLLQNFAAQAVIAMENARLLEELRQRQAELRVTFDNMVDGVAMFDAELRLAAWNRNFQELLDLPDDFLTKRHGFDEFVRYLAERGEFGETDPETIIDRLRGRLHEHYQFERTRPDGTVIEVRHNPMPDGGVVMIYSDITERKRSEAEIRTARDAAEAAYRDLKAAQASLVQAEKMASLGQLTAGIAHEIKNPLNFVNNFADLSVELLDELKETAAPAISALDDIRRTEIDETIGMLTGNLEKIAEHGRRADGIVKSMLEHSRGSSGERRSVDLNGLIEEALNLAYHGARAQDASFNITLERDFADQIAPIELVPQDITRVCLNLIGNGFYAATKRQREGSDPNFKPTLKVSTRDLGDAVELQVRDNGVGIAREIKDKLFQPFFTTKPTGEGTGLGLSISYDIVTQQHGGTIEVNSQVGEFTEFTVRLPRTHQTTTMAEAAS